MYLYETHLHTLEGSACGEVAAADYIDYMIVKGFTGMVVTDHFFNGNCAVDPHLPWKEKVELYCDGFRKAHAAAQGHEFDVIFGIEFNFNGDEYLIYGIDGEWLLDNEDIMGLDRRGVHKKINEAGGIMVQAHPFRERKYLKDIRLTPDICDAVEVYNASNDDNMNALAYEYAKKLGVPMIGGSDIHYPRDVLGGILLPDRIKDTHELAAAIRAGQTVPAKIERGIVTRIDEVQDLMVSVKGPTAPVYYM